MARLEGMTVGDLVTPEQMQSLFGAGMHPLARQRMADWRALAWSNVTIWRWPWGHRSRSTPMTCPRSVLGSPKDWRR
jgi:hypothetical protein